MSDSSLPADVMLALRAGNKIEAIKLLRAKTGLGLKEAKDAVDAVEAADPALKQAVMERRAESFRLGAVLGTLYKINSFALFAAFVVILVMPGCTFREAAVWLDWAFKGAP